MTNLEAEGNNENEVTVRCSRRGQVIKPNRQYFGDQWVNYQLGSPSKKIKASVLNNQFVNSLRWWGNTPTSFLLKQMNVLIAPMLDYENHTLEDWHPFIFVAKVNTEDNSNWDQAMNGPEKVGYFKATEKEIETLETKEAWEVVERSPWMNVLPFTWAFHCKRYPDGSIRKLKARFCVRGDKQVEGVDYFVTNAPVVNWTTVRLMLILSIILGLHTVQVDYSAAFVHAPIDQDPLWNTFSDEVTAKNGVYVSMPRGFTEPGKVLQLKRSLYGLKQAPRNFFQHLKAKLELIGFKSVPDIDPCLFVSDSVICIFYVYDTLFFSPHEEFIQGAINKLQQNDMELEVEDIVAGFLGVHMERNDEEGTIELTQLGLDKHLDIMQIDHLPPKKTPAALEALPMDKDGEMADGTYNYASVVGMLQYLQAHS